MNFLHNKLFNIQCYCWHIKLVLNLFTKFCFEILNKEYKVAKPEEMNLILEGKTFKIKTKNEEFGFEFRLLKNEIFSYIKLTLILDIINNRA